MIYAWQTSPTRSLELYLEELCAQLKRLPLTSKARGELITRIRNVEDELSARDGGGGTA